MFLYISGDHFFHFVYFIIVVTSGEFKKKGTGGKRPEGPIFSRK